MTLLDTLIERTRNQDTFPHFVRHGRPNEFTAPQAIDSGTDPTSTLHLRRNNSDNTNALVLQNMVDGGRSSITYRDENDDDIARLVAHTDEDPAGVAFGWRVYTRRLTPRLDGNMFENHFTVEGKLDFSVVAVYNALLKLQSQDTDGNLWTDQTLFAAQRSAADSANEAVQLMRARSSAVGSNWFMRNLAAADTDGPVVRIAQSNAADDQVALRVDQSANVAAIHVQQSGTQAGLQIARTAPGLGINITGGGYIQMSEQADPANSAADSGRLFMRDNGAGKTQLCVRFATGAAIVIATEV